MWLAPRPNDVQFRHAARPPRHRLAEMAEVCRPRRAAYVGRRHGLRGGPGDCRGPARPRGSRCLRVRAPRQLHAGCHRRILLGALPLAGRPFMDRLAPGHRLRAQRRSAGVRRRRRRGSEPVAHLSALHHGARGTRAARPGASPSRSTPRPAAGRSTGTRWSGP